MATATATTTTHESRRPNLVSVGTIVWLSSELMFFAALFAMYFTIRSVVGVEGEWVPRIVDGQWVPDIGQGGNIVDPETGQPVDGESFLNIPLALPNTIILVLSSVTCQMGVWAAERGLVKRLRFWYFLSFLMGAVFVGGQVYEYIALYHDGRGLDVAPYDSIFFLATGFHGLHVTGGLFAFLFMLGRTYAARRFTREQATSAIVVSYYWHFVDVVWIGLFATIYIIQ